MRRRRVIVGVLAASCVLSSLADVRADAERLLKRWCDGLVACQVREFARPELKGGILCPACGFLHGRVGDVVYPFVSLWKRTGEVKYLEAAKAAVDWCEANVLLPDGSYRNDRQMYWRSTTCFFTVPLGKTLGEHGDRLPAETREKWMRIYRRANESMYTLFEGGFKPNVNYYCIYAVAMQQAGEMTGERKYLDAARRVAALCETYFTDDGLLFGEGTWKGKPVSPGGHHFVDIAYNLEESLPSLLEYARMSGDSALRAKAVASAKAHLAFVLPDGAIDESCSSRCPKWTYWGSRTADGILPLLVELKDDVPYAAELARRTLALYARCTGEDGLLRGGLMYDAAGEPPCVHHAFAKAKTLVDFLASGLADRTEAVPPPRATAIGARHYPSMGVHLASVGPWRATFSANDAFKNDASAVAVGGGALALLWHEGLGPLTVSSPLRFFPEGKNSQDDRHDMVERCLTPRIVADGFVSTGDYSAETTGEMKDGAFRYTAAGAGHRTDYRMTPEAIEIKIDVSRPNARYVLPIVTSPTDAVTVSGKTATIRKGKWILELSATEPVSLAETDRGQGLIWSAVTGCLCTQFEFPIERTRPLTVRARVHADSSRTRGRALCSRPSRDGRDARRPSGTTLRFLFTPAYRLL